MLIYEFSIPAPESSHGKKIIANFTLSNPRKGTWVPNYYLLTKKQAHLPRHTLKWCDWTWTWCHNLYVHAPSIGISHDVILSQVEGGLSVASRSCPRSRRVMRAWLHSKLGTLYQLPEGLFTYPIFKGSSLIGRSGEREWCGFHVEA